MSRSKAKIHTLSGPKFCSKEMGMSRVLKTCSIGTASLATLALSGFLLFVGTPRAQADEC